MGELPPVFFFGETGFDSAVDGFSSSAVATITGPELLDDDSESVFAAVSAPVTEEFSSTSSAVEASPTAVSFAPTVDSTAAASADAGPRCWACPQDSIRGFK
jgi:hypothetical protein